MYLAHVICIQKGWDKAITHWSSYREQGTLHTTVAQDARASDCHDVGTHTTSVDYMAGIG